MTAHGLPLLGSLVLSSQPAMARPDPATTVDAGLGTDFPISVGVFAAVEGPYRLRARFSVGWLPSGYVDVINATCVSFDWYDEVTASLIDAALKNSLVIHPELGWRPLPTAGFHFELGYRVTLLGGSLTGAETVEAASGEPIPEVLDAEALSVRAAATDHMLTVNVGWEFVIAKRLLIDVGLGGSFSAAASATLTAEVDADRSDIGSRLEPQFEDPLIQGEQFLEDTLTRWVHTPTLRLTLAYRHRFSARRRP